MQSIPSACIVCMVGRAFGIAIAVHPPVAARTVSVQRKNAACESTYSRARLAQASVALRRSPRS